MADGNRMRTGSLEFGDSMYDGVKMASKFVTKMHPGARYMSVD